MRHTLEADRDIEEQLDDRDAEDVLYERNGTVVFVLPSNTSPIEDHECDSPVMYE